MKKLQLWVDNEGWKPFEYENISDLKEEFKKRFISIGDMASIGDEASIGDMASIGNRASIGNEASIGNMARIGDMARIGNGASIGDMASIGYMARIGNGASIGDEASIGDRARIGDRVRIKTLFITGSSNTLSYYGTDVIHIGCIKKTIEEWKNEYASVGVENKYTEDEIKEYKTYIDICASLQETMKPEEII